MRWSARRTRAVLVRVVEPVIRDVPLTVDGALVAVVAREELLVEVDLRAALAEVDHRVRDAGGAVDDRLLIVTLVGTADHDAVILDAVDPHAVLSHAAVRESRVFAVVVAVEGGDEPLPVVPVLRLVAFDPAFGVAPSVADGGDRNPELVHAVAPALLTLLDHELGDVGHRGRDLVVEAPGAVAGRRVAASSTTTVVRRVHDGRRVAAVVGADGVRAAAGREAENAENEDHTEQLLPVREALHGTVLPAGHRMPALVDCIGAPGRVFVRVLGVP